MAGQLTTEQQLVVEFVNDHAWLYRRLVDRAGEDCRCPLCTEARLSHWWPKNRRAKGAVTVDYVTETCLGYDVWDEHHACERPVTRPVSRRGPIRCPDCRLAHKRAAVQRSNSRTRTAARERTEALAGQVEGEGLRAKRLPAHLRLTKPQTRSGDVARALLGARVHGRS